MSWINQCYTRLLIDNHITEDDPKNMTRFDPREYVRLVKKAGVEAAMVYACCHNGNCYYPTRVGHMHRNLNGRDIYGETVALLIEEGITPVAYYTSVYHNHSAKTHPAWRMQDAHGRQHEDRYWWSCPNNPEYTAFTKAQISEVITYPVEGIFIDMTFWPVVCCCPNCREKVLSQTGKDIPERLDWNDPDWIDFQRFRERSMVEFCQELAGAIKAQREITVTFQNSPIIFGWALGQTPGIADACDYTSGDFYGGKYQHVLGAKILSAASKYPPFEYMTSRSVNLNDHTSLKSEAELRCEAATTLASGGAYFFIDAINPDGTLNEAVYERLGRVSRSLAPFAGALKQHQPALRAETGLYFSMASFIDPAFNGKSLVDLAYSFDYTFTPAYTEMLGASMILTRAHRPFKAVRDGEGDLGRLRTLVINNAQVMSEAEVEKVREFVRSGGTLVATGLTSLKRPDGSGSGDFALADVFGVSFCGKMSRRVNYLVVGGEQKEVLCNQPAPLVRLNGARPLAGLSEPLFDPDAKNYTSIHSNPPGRDTGCPGMTLHEFGKGRCIYIAPAVMALQQDSHQTFVEAILREFAPAPEVAETNMPVAVEITLLEGQKSVLVGLVNYQKELPNVPVHDLRVKLRLGEKRPQRCSKVSDGQMLDFSFEDGLLEFSIPELETIEMVEIE